MIVSSESELMVMSSRWHDETQPLLEEAGNFSDESQSADADVEYWC